MAYMIPYALMAAGTLYQARQQRTSAEYQAKVDEVNATVTRQQTNAEEEQRRRAMAMELGRNRAAAYESGFNPGGGSFLNLLTDSAAEMELDVLTARYRGQLEALGLQTDADVNRRNAKAATRTGYLNAFSTLYGGQMRADYTQSTRINSQFAGGGE